MSSITQRNAGCSLHISNNLLFYIFYLVSMEAMVVRPIYIIQLQSRCGRSQQSAWTAVRDARSFAECTSPLVNVFFFFRLLNIQFQFSFLSFPSSLSESFCCCRLLRTEIICSRRIHIYIEETGDFIWIDNGNWLPTNWCIYVAQLIDKWWDNCRRATPNTIDIVWISLN